MFLLNKVRVVDDQLGHLHQQTWVVFQFLKSRRRADIGEILDEVLDAEFLKFLALELVGVDEELDHIIVVNILH